MTAIVRGERTMRHRLAAYVSIAILTATVLVAADAPEQPDDLVTLTEQRNALEDQRGALVEERSRLVELLRQRTSYDNAKAAYTAAAASAPARAAYFRDQVEALESVANFNGSNTQEILSQRLATVNTQLKKIDADLRIVNRRLERLARLEEQAQSYKKSISTIFGVIMASLVVLFAWVCFDARVRRSVFRGAGGLQMVTLFSVVMAVVMFGMTNILEGKELSALLGSLIGYILGGIHHRRDATSDSEDRATDAAGKMAEV